MVRGKWILATIMGSPLPTPPPDVPVLQVSDATLQPASLRERLELHRDDAACASCHNTMDPLGFGLENFDVIGRWRESVDGEPIDASGRLPGGAEFSGAQELKRLLLERKDQFIHNLTRKMLGYALARSLNHEDACVVEEIAKRVADDGYRAQTLILEIVKSVPFRYKSTVEEFPGETPSQ